MTHDAFAAGAAPAVVRVLPDDAAIDRAFDYSVPATLARRELLAVGTRVRIDLHGRRTGGWVVALDPDTPAQVRARLRPLARVSSVGPPASVVALCEWVAWRWAGRTANVLRFTDPPQTVLAATRPPALALPAATPSPSPAPADDDPDEVVRLARRALARLGDSAEPRVLAVQLPPGADSHPLVRVVAEALGGPVVVVVPTHTAAAALGEALAARAPRLRVALLPDAWAAARTGAADVVVGARAAVFAPCERASAFVVLEEHDERLQDERAPTWHAREVAIERARRDGVPCLLVSALPTLEARAASAAPPLRPSRAFERGAWARLEVIDRADDDGPRGALLSPRLTAVLRGEGSPVVCVLQHKGRARLLACRACERLAACDHCGAAVRQPSAEPVLHCERCGGERPLVCLDCGSARLKVLRVGVQRAREEVEALAGRPAAEVTAEQRGPLPAVPVLVGTEAVLLRVERADAVVFLDFDGELLAPRVRSTQRSLSLLARASQLVGGRSGVVTVQTRVPAHEVLLAAAAADPARAAAADESRRRALGLPPFGAVAVVSGPGTDAFATRFTRSGSPEGPLRVIGTQPALLVAGDPAALADALERSLDAHRAERGERLRVHVDPFNL